MRVFSFTYDHKREQWSTNRTVQGRKVVYVVDDLSRQPEADQSWLVALAPEPFYKSDEIVVILCELLFKLPLQNMTFEAGENEEGQRLWQRDISTEDLKIRVVVDRCSPRQPRSESDHYECLFHRLDPHKDGSSLTVVVRLKQRPLATSDENQEPVLKLGKTG